MTVINTGLLEAGLKSEFFNRLAGVKTYYGDLCTRVASTLPTEKYRWLGSVPQMRQFTDSRRAKGLRSESYDVSNLKYEATIEVDRDELSDDQTGQIRIRVGEMADRAAAHKDYLIGQLLENGGTAGYLAYDGLTYFNDAHVSGDSGSQDNNLTGTAATATQPTVAEFRAALMEMIGAMMAFKDDQGQPMMMGASGLKIVVPTVYTFVAMEAINAAMISATNNILQGVADIIPFPFCTSADRFYLLKTDSVIRPFIFQDREPIEFKSIAEGSEEEFLREKYYYGVRARYRVTYGYWQNCVRYIFT